MKKWMYVIFPGSMLALFLVFFLSHEKEMKARAEQQAISLKAQQDDAAAKKKVAEDKAREDAKKRAEDRAKDDAEKAAAKLAKQAAEDKKVLDAMEAALAEGAKSEQEVARLEAELDRLHKEKNRLSDEAFALAKEVEAAKVNRRTAEMGQQRTVDMIATRAGNGVLARLPPPPALPPAKP